MLRYYLQFEIGAPQQGVRDYLLTGAAIGGIIKHNASISRAEVGCQAEVGSAAAMAAAGLCAAMGGTPAQVENAAEIALKHDLDMTCDSIRGLMRIPCIERNASGAVKAVTAASLAVKSMAPTPCARHLHRDHAPDRPRHVGPLKGKAYSCRLGLQHPCRTRYQRDR